MTTKSPSSLQDQADEAKSIENLPHEELLHYGKDLGLELEDNLTSSELFRRVQQRCELLNELDREALLDVIKWSRRPVRKSADKVELAREIARIHQTNYDSLSRRGLVTLARLRDISADETEGAEDLIDKLRKQEGFWKRFHRKRRRWIGSWLASMIDGGTSEPESDEYQFLPDDVSAESEAAKSSLKRQIEDYGVVGGIASRLRGAADDYIKIKLDEIEERIDTKLNQIDQRLAEWRDREVANRLKILRITLAFTVLVAIMSLGYNYLKSQVTVEKAPETEQVTDQQ